MQESGEKMVNGGMSDSFEKTQKVGYVVNQLNKNVIIQLPKLNTSPTSGEFNGDYIQEIDDQLDQNFIKR